MGKRIRHPEKKQEVKQEEEKKEEEKTHFVLDVQDSTLGSSSNFGK
jgi:hypothetical protein